MNRRLCIFLAALSLTSSMSVFAAPDKPRTYRGRMAAADEKESHKALARGDLLLVSVSPSTDVEFQVRDADGHGVEGISFEHAGATKKYVFAAETSSNHSLVLQNRQDRREIRYTLRLEIVAATEPAERKLQRVLAHSHSSADPGAAVTVAQNGKLAFSGAFGSADVEQGVDVSKATVFDTASVAKHVTGVAVAMLVREGRLSLDDDIRKYVAEVPDFGETITVRNLLHHTSGLRDFPGLMLLGEWHDYDVISLEQIVSLVSRQQDLNFPPGTEYTYSNTGYSLLAVMIQRITGQTLAEWAKAQWFLPLGMNDTRFLSEINEVIPRRANGYSLTDQRELLREPNNLAAMGSSSFLTTAEDMGRWLVNFDSLQVGGDAIRDLMTVRGRNSNGADLGYGLGLGHGEYRGLRRLEHGGSSGGFRSHLLHFPDERLSVCVMGNQANFDAAAWAYLAAKVYLGDKLPRERNERPSVPRNEGGKTKDLKIDIPTLDTYVGSYEIQPGEVIEVSREGNGLRLRPKGHPEAPPIVAKPMSRTRFTGPPNGSIEFVANEHGKVTKGLIRNGETIIFEAKRLEDPRRAVDLNLYAGTYFSPELQATYRLAVIEGALVARQMKRTRRLSWIHGDDFGTDDGLNISFGRSGGRIAEFRVTTGPRVRDVRFIKTRK